MACFAHHFKQDVVGNVRADVDLVIRCIERPDDGTAAPKPKRARTAAAAAPNGDATYPVEIHRFPAHNIILNAYSDYFRAQGARWQDAAQPPATPTAGNGSSPSGGSSIAASAQRPALYLTIDDAEQLPAAEAVIAEMYGVPGAISSLEQQQAVHAAIIADKVRVEAAGQQAVQALQAAARSERLTTAALQALAAVPDWPSCMLQLLPVILEHAPCCRDSTADLEALAAADAGGMTQQILLAVFGDLQELWSNAQLQALLGKLPRQAMQLLLSSDQLRVPSEDTVLYTAKQYVQAQPATAQAAAKAALAPLVRAPQLSLFALSCAALPADSSQQLLGRTPRS
uniref:BTB domain-containing protein n=1 Tax=Tetradesmus obliquus TaxID=3088 RepID=A0A383VEL0_TETOB|eukprot:jgi/Sobl393_1/16177/SZX63985.1